MLHAESGFAFDQYSDPPHVTLRTRLPLFSRATSKRLGEPGDEATCCAQ